MNIDSVDKIVSTYFRCVTSEKFTYRGVQYDPKPLILSPLLFRGFECPPYCGGCCPKFSLDYLPLEDKPDIPLEPRIIEFNGDTILIYSNLQNTNYNHHCNYLDRNVGRCTIHGLQPFSCDFELIRFLTYQSGYNRLTQKLYGRGWQLLRYDGNNKGALCEMSEPTDYSRNEVIRKLERLKTWCDNFNLNNKVGKILEWAHSSDKAKSITF